MPIKKYRVGKQDIISIISDLESSGKEVVAKELSKLIFGTNPYRVKRNTSFGVTHIMKVTQDQEDYDGNEPKRISSTFSKKPGGY